MPASEVEYDLLLRVSNLRAGEGGQLGLEMAGGDAGGQAPGGAARGWVYEADAKKSARCSAASAGA